MFSRIGRLLREAAAARRLSPMALRVRAEGLTYLDSAALAELHHAIAQVEQSGEPGVLVEVGCALGGSALVMAAARRSNRPLLVYDVFGMPPAPTEGDGPDVHARYAEIAAGRSPGIRGGTYYGYRDDLLPQVRETFLAHGIDPEQDEVRFIPGLVQDTLRLDEPIAVAHVDCDRYASVRTSLERLARRLTPRGVMIIDDYHTKSGCRRAVDEYLEEHRDDFRTMSRARLHLVRR